MWRAIIFVSLGGCVSSEFALSRQGRIAGDVESGGIGWVATSTVHREDGVQNGSVGMSIQYLQQAPGGDGAIALGADARYARQLAASRRWRGFGRISLGLSRDEMRDPAGRMLGAAIGVERFAMPPDPERPADSGWFSTSLGVVYTRSTHETLGDGDFLGVELGMRVGIDLFADRAGATP